MKAESLHRHCTGGRTGSLSSAAKLAILRQTANGLSYLHAKGILNHIDGFEIFGIFMTKTPDNLCVQFQ